MTNWEFSLAFRDRQDTPRSFKPSLTVLLKACLLYRAGNGGIQQVDNRTHFHFLSPASTLLSLTLSDSDEMCGPVIRGWLLFFITCSRYAMRETVREREREAVVSISISVCQSVREGQDKWQQNEAGLESIRGSTDETGPINHRPGQASASPSPPDDPLKKSITPSTWWSSVSLSFATGCLWPLRAGFDVWNSA